MQASARTLVVVLFTSHAALAAVHPPNAPAPLDNHEHGDDAFSARETARLRAHFAVVLDELMAADTSHLDDAQLLSRARLIETLRAYAAEGRFPRNRGHAPFRTPVFVDDDGVHCAMGYLLAEMGAGPLVDEIRATRNLAYVADLADDPRLHAWLDVHGLSLREAGRIQPGYSSEEPMVAGLCQTQARIEEQVSGTALVIVDVEMTNDVGEGCSVNSTVSCRWIEANVLGLVDVISPCTDEPCASRFTDVEGKTAYLSAARFVAGEKRRAIAFTTFVDDELVLDGRGTFAEDALYGDNADGSGWLLMAVGPLVEVPDAVLTDALTVGSVTGCLDVLLAHDTAGLCTIGTLPWLASPTAEEADAACEAALAEPQPDDDDEESEDEGLGPDDEPGDDDSVMIACGAAPNATGGLAPLALLLAWRRRRRTAAEF